ncbi:hypothetical protein BHM03_00025132 [Ensete ventricosum]|nr:hypothetical protein BHM03_00025132 [Ensete ventricosum]
MLTIRRGSGFRQATGPVRKRKWEQQVRLAAGFGEGWLWLLATVGQGCDRGGCGRCDCGGGKKMRRARLEVTVAAREDGCSLRLHDREEEWAT